ncbi:DUF523 domain-containing protein, partial [Erwinia amylovora]|uniref:DUF523 domain-containing protein n=1 Tax=Erwinia amylovora TaxID=552 RepID=UPI0020C005D2
FAAQQLAPFLRDEPICPEMAIGLPTPRPALRLTEATQGDISLSFSNGSDLPVTEKMQAFSEEKISQVHHLCGYIVCAKSPSCGMERVRIYQPDTHTNRKAGTGVF